jgi:hypothetical protein
MPEPALARETLLAVEPVARSLLTQTHPLTVLQALLAIPQDTAMIADQLMCPVEQPQSSPPITVRNPTISAQLKLVPMKPLTGLRETAPTQQNFFIATKLLPLNTV